MEEALLLPDSNSLIRLSEMTVIDRTDCAPEENGLLW